MNRREFLQIVSSAGVVSVPLVSLFNGCGTTGLVSYRLPMSHGRLELKVVDYPELSTPGGAIEVDVEGFGETIVVVRTAESSYRALSPTCTHLGCTVHKEPALFRCPCHGSTYTLDGSVVRGPAEKPLTGYRTELTADSLLIYL